MVLIGLFKAYIWHWPSVRVPLTALAYEVIGYSASANVCPALPLLAHTGKPTNARPDQTHESADRPAHSKRSPRTDLAYSICLRGSVCHQILAV